MVQQSPVGPHLPGKHRLTLPVPESPIVLLNEALLGLLFFTPFIDVPTLAGVRQKVWFLDLCTLILPLSG